MTSPDISMPDLLVRNLPEAELRQLDSRARALGLSRSEYVRRRLRQYTGAPTLTLTDLSDSLTRMQTSRIRRRWAADGAEP
jgi:hypothetical protein